MFFILSQYCHADFLKNTIYFKYGLVHGNPATTLDDYCGIAHSFGTGMNILSSKYTQLWCVGDLYYFPFKRDAIYPVDIIYKYEYDVISGDDIYIMTAMTKFIVFWPEDIKPFYFFNSLALGILKRTNTHLYSNFPNLPSADISFPVAFGYSFSMGLEYRLNKKTGIIFDMAYIDSFTKPTRTTFTSIALLLTFKP